MHASFDRSWRGFIDDENLVPIDGRSRVDFRLRRLVGRHSVYIDVLNATNHKYEEFGFVLADFGGGAVPYGYAGAPRAVRAGVTLAF